MNEAKNKIMDNVKGNPISVSHDEENGKHWINIKAGDVLIMKCDKDLWNNEGSVSFTPEIRDAILETIMRFYG